MTANEPPRCEAVLLAGFGGPSTPAEVRPFLDSVLAGRPVPRRRYEAVVRHYEAIGGCSPFNETTLRQGALLREALGRRGLARTAVEVGMRHSRPSIDEAVEKLAQRGVQNVAVFVLAAFRCEASWERYRQAIEAARAQVGARAPQMHYPAPWHLHRLFLAAQAGQARKAFARLPQSSQAEAALVFSAHSIPLSMARRSHYVEELRAAAQAVAALVGRFDWQLGFQSRSETGEPWLTPDVGDLLAALGRPAAVLLPIGFLCDHVETLYDLDVELASRARELGIQLERAPALNDHPLLIETIAEVVEPYLRASPDGR